MAVDKASAPLEDLMVAMDVVDTLRHEEAMVERELDGDGRRERLLKRLRDMYSAQGIDVPDHVLQEGISALEQERFNYQAVAPSWRTRLAHMWVSRGRWGKPLAFLTIIGSLFFTVYFYKEILPTLNLPTQIDTSIAAITSKAKEPLVVENATQVADRARTFLDKDDVAQAKSELARLRDMETRLNLSYKIRVVSRDNERSGVWRIPPNNPSAKNYYLIVEAIDSNNDVVGLDVLNEENNETKKKTVWGLRVSEQTFRSVAADKSDDGIIQNNVVGEKKVGFLKHEYLVETSGATITEWPDVDR